MQAGDLYSDIRGSVLTGAHDYVAVLRRALWNRLDTLKRDQTKAKQVVALDVALRRGAPTDSITICDGGGAVGHDSFMWRLHGVICKRSSDSPAC